MMRNTRTGSRPLMIVALAIVALGVLNASGVVASERQVGGSPAGEAGFKHLEKWSDVRILTGYFDEDWAYLLPQLDQPFLKNRPSTYLRELIKGALGILKYAGYEVPFCEHRELWLLCPEWRQTARESAILMLQGLGSKAAPSAWAALEAQIRNEDTPAKKRRLNEARKCAEEKRKAWDGYMSHVASEYRNIANEYSWVLELGEKEFTRIAWTALLEAHSLRNDLLSLSDHGWGYSGTAPGRNTPGEIEQLISKEGMTKRDAVTKMLAKEPIVYRGRDGKLHRTVSHAMFYRNLSDFHFFGRGMTNTWRETIPRTVRDEVLIERLRVHKTWHAKLCTLRNPDDNKLLCQLIRIPGEPQHSCTEPYFREFGVGAERRRVFASVCQEPVDFFMVQSPCEEYRSSLELVLIRMGAKALPVLRANLRNAHAEVAKTANLLVRRIAELGGRNEEQSFAKLENIYQRRARLALCVWDCGTPAPHEDVARVAKEELLRRGRDAIPEILKIMAIEELELGEACGQALRLLSDQDFGDNYPAWEAWHQKR